MEDGMFTEAQIAVIKDKLEIPVIKERITNIDRNLAEVLNKLDRVFVTKQELVNATDRISRVEKTMDNMQTKLWGLIILVLAEIIRLLFSVFNK